MGNRIYPQLLNTVSAPAWKQFGVERFSGIVAPVPYLYSENSVGCGEFLDEILLLAFCKAIGAKAIMELPINPIGYGGSPYAAEDPHALEPMLGSPKGISDEGFKVEDFNGAINELKREFSTGTGRINYAVRPRKIDLFWQMFKSLKGQESPAFRAFVKEFKDRWLRDYTLYTVIKEQQKDEEKSWKRWPNKKLRDHELQELNNFERKNSERITFYAWLQWQLSMQKLKVRNFADSINRKIIGDLQIFPSSDSTGPWAHRHLYNMNEVAGAPPDPYAAKGQRWDSHPYNWELVHTVGREYIEAQQEYLYRHNHGRRYDHSIGVPRIWSIPIDADFEEQGLPGKYIPEPHQREMAGLERYKLLFGAEPELAPFFEDLGKLPSEAEDLFNWEAFCAALGAVCMDVAFWKKEWESDPSVFIKPEEYRELSMSTFGPHDMELADEYYEKILGTVDRELFERICRENGLNHEALCKEFFDEEKSSGKRLRWKSGMASHEMVINANGDALSKLSPDKVNIFTNMHRSTFHEQEIFWSLINMEGKAQEIAGPDFVKKGLEYTTSANSIANFELLPLIVKLDPKIYGSKRPRINIPGTKDGNWEEASPISLEDLNRNEHLIEQLREIYTNSDRLTQ